MDHKMLTHNVLSITSKYNYYRKELSVSQIWDSGKRQFSSSLSEPGEKFRETADIYVASRSVWKCSEQVK